MEKNDGAVDGLITFNYVCWHRYVILLFNQIIRVSSCLWNSFV